jgi:tRNA (guanine37-N1)-methyltransferase
VPKILLSGDDKKIEKWRQEQAEIRTKTRRPDILKDK